MSRREWNHRGAAGMNWRGVTVATVAGGVLIVVGAQLAAKPTVPAVAGLAPRAGASARIAPAIQLVSTQPRPLALAGQPPVRELFRPLVTRPSSKTGAPGLPAGRAPALPTAAGPEKSKPAAPAASSPTAPEAPAGPSANDLRMLGLVENGDGARVLLKKIDTGETRYVGKGEEVFGFKVTGFTESQVSLEREGKTSSVAMSSFVAVEGPGGSSTASASGFTGGGGGGRGERGNDRDARRAERRGGGDASASGTGAAAGGFSTAQIFSLPTWTERLRKLEEVKAQVPAEQYGRLHKFMTERAQRESAK